MRALRVDADMKSTTWTCPGLSVEHFLPIVPKLLVATCESPCVVVCAGSNNVGVDTPEGLSYRIEQVVGAIKCVRPKAVNVIVGLLPRLPNRRRQDVPPGFIVCCNDFIRCLCDRMNLGFVDVCHAIGTDRRCFAGDGLHLSLKGKLILQKAITYIVSGKGKRFVARPGN